MTYRSAISSAAGLKGPSTHKMAVRLVFLAFALATSSVATAEQFSIQCERDAWLHHVTFDTDTRRVVYETASGTPMKGHISAISANEITFDLIQASGPKFNLIWRPTDHSMTVLGLPDSTTRPTIVMRCTNTTLRPALQAYDEIAPMK